jgi:hypothetical protein
MLMYLDRVTEASGDKTRTIYSKFGIWFTYTAALLHLGRLLALGDPRQPLLRRG